MLLLSLSFSDEEMLWKEGFWEMISCLERVWKVKDTLEAWDYYLWDGFFSLIEFLVVCNTR